MIRVQMVGTQRSGSNMLRLMLGAHDQLFAPPSVHMYQTFRELQTAYGDLAGRRHRYQIIDDLRQLIALNVFTWPGGPPAADEIDARWCDATIAGLCCAVYDAAAARQGASGWLCKSLDNGRHLPDLLSAIPNLQVLHLLRDGRDVAISFRTLPIGPKHPVIIGQEWVADQRAVSAAEVAVDPGRFIQVRYEELIDAPAGTVERVCRFLGVPFDERSLEFHRSSDAQAAPKRSPLWQNLDRPVLADNSGKYRDPMVRDFVEIFEGAAFDALVDHGYEPIYAHGPTTFTEAQIANFLDQDLALRAEARRHADPATEALHGRQADFVNRLSDRM